MSAAQWAYDPEAGAGYLTLRPGTSVEGTEAAGMTGPLVDFTPDGSVHGIEITNAEDAAAINALITKENP